MFILYSSFLFAFLSFYFNEFARSLYNETRECENVKMRVIIKSEKENENDIRRVEDWD
jgi:hypothetical protein